MAHTIGMLHLAVLIANPGREVAALDLTAGVAALVEVRATAASASEQPVLDPAAVRAYRDRLTRLQSDIDELDERGDSRRAAHRRTEHEWIMAELARAAGFGGRTRPFTDDSERARVAVGKAIRRSIDRIADADPMIGEHLRRTVHTGFRCYYQPAATLPTAA